VNILIFNWRDIKHPRAGGAVAKSVVWYLVGTFGYSAMAAGIPIAVKGKTKGEYWKSKLPAATYISPNGAKFVCNF